jgi:hypothetical protein
VGALYWRRPTAAAAGEFGLRPSDFTEPSVDVWPEAWDAVQLFSRISNQWRAGPGGAFGLDYLVVYHELDRRALSPEQYDGTLAQLRVIEGAALDLIRKESGKG